MTKEKRGRKPTGPRGEVRSKRVETLLAPSELEAVRRAAAAKGQPLSAWLRTVALLIADAA